MSKEKSHVKNILKSLWDKISYAFLNSRMFLWNWQSPRRLYKRIFKKYLMNGNFYPMWILFLKCSTNLRLESIIHCRSSKASWPFRSTIVRFFKENLFHQFWLPWAVRSLIFQLRPCFVIDQGILDWAWMRWFIFSMWYFFVAQKLFWVREFFSWKVLHCGTLYRQWRLLRKFKFTYRCCCRECVDTKFVCVCCICLWFSDCLWYFSVTSWHQCIIAGP